MPYKIDLGAFNGIFAMPNEVVDKHLKLVGRDALKVLLYLMRHSGETISDRKIAESTGVSKENLPDAIGYWVEVGLLSKTDGEYTPYYKDRVSEVSSEYESPETSSDIPTDNERFEKVTRFEDSERKGINTISSIPPRPDRGTCARFIENNNDVREMLDAAQSIVGRTLSESEISSYVYLADTFKIKCEILLIETQYLMMKNHFSRSRLESLSVEIQNKGHETLESADAYIQQKLKTDKNCERFKVLAGIRDRNLTARESAFIRSWYDEKNLPEEWIHLAFEKTVDNTGKISFAYIDKILSSYYENGGPENVSAAKSRRKRNSSERSYDIDKYEEVSFMDMIDSSTED